jgi:putative ABC transport system permease protein
VLALVLKEGVLMAAAGVVIGLGASAVVTKLMSTLLVGVGPRDPVAFAIAATVLLFVAALASYVPARRAIRVDPITALRND